MSKYPIQFEDIVDSGPPVTIIKVGMKNRIIKRFSDKKLVDYTNQDNYHATDINDDVFEAAFNDAMAQFQTYVGDVPYFNYDTDIGCIQFLTLSYLFVYAMDAIFANFFFATAQAYMLKSHEYRLNKEIITPTIGQDETYADNKQSIENLPRPIIDNL